MIYVFNKNKIFSYVLACSFVLMIFSFHENIIPDSNIELIKVSSNVIENEKDINNNINELKKKK